MTIGLGLAALLLASATAPAGGLPERLAQLTIRERVIVRVPTRLARPQAATRWRERSAPRCMSLRGLAGAAVTDRDSVDLIFNGSVRVRAQLESGCNGLDYYSGFYINPTDDGRICAGRDSIHARSGGECEIKRFRSLVPAE